MPTHSKLHGTALSCRPALSRSSAFEMRKLRWDRSSPISPCRCESELNFPRQRRAIFQPFQRLPPRRYHPGSWFGNWLSLISSDSLLIVPGFPVNRAELVFCEANCWRPQSIGAAYKFSQAVPGNQWSFKGAYVHRALSSPAHVHRFPVRALSPPTLKQA